MRRKAIFQYVPKNEDWEVCLDARGNMTEMSIAYMVLDENHDIVLYEKVEHVTFDDVWLEAIAFCKFYGINRDKELVKAKRTFDAMLTTFNEGWLSL